MRKYLPFILLLTIISCAKIPQYDGYNYFVECENNEDSYLYPLDNKTSQPILSIPRKTVLYTRSNRKGKYIKVYYGSHYGYVLNRKFKFKKSRLNSIPAHKIQEQNLIYQAWANSFVPRSYRHSRSYSSYSTSSHYRSRGGTVKVRGYYRKNGSYVRPHTRSAPSRRH